MKRWIGLMAGFALIITILVLVATQATPVVAQVAAPPTFTVEITDYPATVQPGASYNIKVRVTRPSGMLLPTWTTGDTPPKWEVRIYFYDGLNCYSQGEMTTIEGSQLYSGWWNWRVQGDAWTAGMDDTREFTIQIKVVDYPRAQADITDGGMNEIPVGEEIKLKARLRLRWGDTDLQFGDSDNNGVIDNITFTYYNQTYGTTFDNTKDNKTTADEEKYKVGNIYIEKSAAGYWQIDFDTIKSGIEVSAAGTAFPLEIVIVGVVVLMVVVVAILFAKRRGREELPSVPEFAPPPPPEAPPAPPEAPPAPPEAPPVPPETPPEKPPETPPPAEGTATTP